MPLVFIDFLVNSLAHNHFQVLTLDANGALSVLATLQLEWFDIHRVWEPLSSVNSIWTPRAGLSGDAGGGARGRGAVGRWRFPPTIAIPAAELWVPALRLANCAAHRPSSSDSSYDVFSNERENAHCTLRAELHSDVVLRSDGRASYRRDAMLSARCELVLTGVLYILFAHKTSGFAQHHF